MIKLPRFIKEYKNYMIKCLKENDLMQDCLKDVQMARIEKAYGCLERGLISIHEFIKTCEEI